LQLAQELALRSDLVNDFKDTEVAERIQSWAGNGGSVAMAVCTDDIPAVLWTTKTLRTRGVVVNIGLPTKPIQFDASGVVSQEKSIKGFLVPTKMQIDEMLKGVDK
jgi:D-arabinose 1-dehydrogenase-like Zn-dependent alcohol dehydrogenase